MPLCEDMPADKENGMHPGGQTRDGTGQGGEVNMKHGFGEGMK